MGAVFKSSAGYVSGGGSNARHITRVSELIRGNNGEERDLLNEEGPRFWTRNIKPDFMIQGDPKIGEFAHHVYGHESDIELAEERLEEALERGLLKPKPGEELKLRSADERAEAMLKPRKSTFANATELEKEVINFRGLVDIEEEIESIRPRRGGGKTRTFYHQERPLDVDIKNSDAQALVNDDLENSPYKDLPTGCALHYHQGRLHAHALTLARTQDNDEKGLGYKLQLGHHSHRSQGDRWAHRWREFTGDDLEYEERKRKKEETKKYRKYALEQRRQGLDPGREPERVQNQHNQKLLKLRSQIFTDLITIGENPAKFFIVERLDKETSMTQPEPEHAQATESREIGRTDQEEIDFPFTTLKESNGHQRQTKRSTKLNVQQPARDMEPQVSALMEQEEVLEPIPQWKLEVEKLAGDAINFQKVVTRTLENKLGEARHYLRNVSYEDATAVKLGREVDAFGQFEYEIQKTSTSYKQVAQELNIEVPDMPEYAKEFFSRLSDHLPSEQFEQMHSDFKTAQQELPKVLELRDIGIDYGHDSLEFLQEALNFSRQTAHSYNSQFNQYGAGPVQDLELEKEKGEIMEDRYDLSKEHSLSESQTREEINRGLELEDDFIIGM